MSLYEVVPTGELHDEGGLECLPVIQMAKLDIPCDSCSISLRVFDLRVAGSGSLPDGSNAYTETVRLLKVFREHAGQAPAGTPWVEFVHDSWILGENGFSKQHWRVRVEASRENGLRCLRITEAPSKGKDEVPDNR